ncbi:MAG TPA: LLM class flavin-dependent oxidoreductase [Methanosarcinaceae archaeon]|nr:LLM class flavin-dependent oxidoreductase [Methanosarcinaceae archaeon]
MKSGSIGAYPSFRQTQTQAFARSILKKSIHRQNYASEYGCSSICLIPKSSAESAHSISIMAAVGNASHPRDFEYAVRAIKKGADSANRDFSKFDVGAYTSFSVADTSEAAVKAARPVTAFIVVGSPDAVFEKHGISLNNVEKVRAGFKKGFGDAIAASTDDMVDAFSICGNPDECISRIDELIKAGVTQIVTGSPLGPKKKDSIELIGKEIIPHFKN